MRQKKYRLFLQTLMLVLPVFILISIVLTRYVPYIKLGLLAASAVLYFINNGKLAQEVPGAEDLNCNTEYDKYSTRTVNWLFFSVVYCLFVVSNTLFFFI